MQDENASRKRAVAAARIAHAAWSGGPHGAAAATAIEAGKHLVRPMLAAVTVIFGLPLLFLAAIPCNFFDAPSVKSADIQEMTAQAQNLNASWKRQRSLEQQAVELFVSLLPKNLGFISVETRLGNTNDYWQIAITSVLHEQDVALLDEDKIVQTMKDKMQYKLEPKYKDGKLVGYILVIYDMTPDELMDKLAFAEQQRDWAALIADTIADSDYTAPVGSSDNTADEDLSDIVFTGRGNSKSVVYFSQYDSRWGSQMYGRTNTIAGAGCGPSSLAICISTLTNKTVTPPEVCEWSVKTGHRCEGSGSYHSLIPDGAAHWGVPCRGIGQKTADSGFAGRETGRGDHESGAFHARRAFHRAARYHKPRQNPGCGLRQLRTQSKGVGHQYFSERVQQGRRRRWAFLGTGLGGTNGN